ncbi:hypothetical protein DSO57_1021692 [Entomophthora muscae]|uniref:Uncharacterized protein n=1 Tax=Entomophthora muscae TaxID=34485 RepID=A0ACC2SS69_9FUNG|nr:hypothetical protein DSO57_1021692 [Entomophthora muscae]
MLHLTLNISLNTPPNLDHKTWTLEDLQWYTHPNAPKEPYQIVSDGKAIIIYPLIFNGKYNNPDAYLVPMEPPLTPKLTISAPPTSDTTGQNSQFLGVLYLALTGLIDSALPATGPWAVAGKALFYLVKLGPIIWWAMSVPASTPPSPTGVLQYSWYSDRLPRLGSSWQQKETRLSTQGTRKNHQVQTRSQHLSSKIPRCQTPNCQEIPQNLSPP